MPSRSWSCLLSFCCMRRIWANKISFSVSCPRDTAHPGSGSAQSLLRIRSGWLTFAHPNYHFRQAAAQPTKRFNSSRGGRELVPHIKMARMCPILGPSLRVFVLLFFRARDLERSLFSKSPAYTSHKHASYCLALSLLIYLDNKLRSRMFAIQSTAPLPSSTTSSSPAASSRGPPIKG